MEKLKQVKEKVPLYSSAGHSSKKKPKTQVNSQYPLSLKQVNDTRKKSGLFFFFP